MRWMLRGGRCGKRVLWREARVGCESRRDRDDRVGPVFDALDRSMPTCAWCRSRSPTMRCRWLICQSWPRRCTWRVCDCRRRMCGRRPGACRRVLPPGSVTVNAWLASSHLVSGVKASRLVQLGIWLGDHDEASAAFATGDVSAAHLSVMRSVSECNRSRREAFAEVRRTVRRACAACRPVGFAAGDECLGGQRRSRHR